MSIVFKSRVFDVEVSRHQFPNGTEREITVVRHRPSVVLIPITGEGRVVLIQQYRPSVGQVLWEIPAGGVNDGETAEEAAVRECEEEIGLVPGVVERIRGLYPAPGFCDEELIFFRVSSLTDPPPDSTRHPDEDEDITAKAVTIDEARAMVRRGEIIDLKTAYGLSLL
jgi:ADP-ribose pyrophosphatase